MSYSIIINKKQSTVQYQEFLAAAASQQSIKLSKVIDTIYMRIQL